VNTWGRPENLCCQVQSSAAAAGTENAGPHSSSSGLLLSFLPSESSALSACRVPLSRLSLFGLPFPRQKEQILTFAGALSFFYSTDTVVSRFWVSFVLKWRILFLILRTQRDIFTAAAAVCLFDLLQWSRGFCFDGFYDQEKLKTERTGYVSTNSMMKLYPERR
jgi:hypothetical protein